MLDLLLLELEGVVIDTREARRAAMLRSLADEGVAVSIAEYEDAAAGLTPRQGAEALLVRHGVARDETALALVALRAERAFSRQLAGGAVLRDGAAALVARAYGRARLGLVTRARRLDAQFALALAGLEYAFEVVVTADDVLDPKPAPEGYRLTLDRLHRRRAVTLGACVAIEDAVAGIRAAKQAGVRCLALGAPGELPAHHALEADGMVTSLADVTLDALDALAASGKERV